MLKVVGASWFQTRISKLILAAVALLGILILIVGEIKVKEEDGNYAATVTWAESTGFHIEFWGQGNDPGDIPLGVARAYFKPVLTADGWAKLEIQTDGKTPDWIQAFAAGLLEGSLTWRMIHWHWTNTVQSICQTREHLCQEVYSTLQHNEEWVRKKARDNGGSSPFWHQVYLFYMQLDGLETGWRHGVERNRQEVDIPHLDFIWMNAMTDIIDLERRYNNPLEPPIGLYMAANFSSIFVKYLQETQEMLLAHNTGALYQSMLRLLKRYELNYHETSEDTAKTVSGQVIEFSSYPGSIHSQDDFYMVSGVSEGANSHQLEIASIPINNYNRALWKKSKPHHQVLLGPRIMSANRLAKEGRLWVHTMEESNSGTGNRQWVVADTGRIATERLIRQRRARHRRHRQHHLRGLLLVVEQLPGLIRSSDVTENLITDGYWASLRGLPFHQDICQASHSDEMKQVFEKSSLAINFRQDQTSANDVPSTIYLMRNNFFNNSLKNEDVIAPRGDLHFDPQQPLGVIDTKIASCGPNRPAQFHALAGPSFSMDASFSEEDDDDDDDENDEPQDGDGMKNYPVLPFKWSSSSFVNLSHAGHADVWQFPTIIVDWVWNRNQNETVLSVETN